jgi:DMSO/TMAO reductase YedYZ molybdopterin-dependent catalytic subunit
MKSNQTMTRRAAITAGVASLGAVVFARYPRELPPTYGHILRMGDAVTYAAQRALLPRQSLAREYTRADITSFPAIGTTDPGARRTELGQEYKKLQADGFKDWKLEVEGSVKNPQTFSLAELKELPSRTQITRHACEEGWSAIGEWTGVQLRHVLEAVELKPSARFVVYTSYDDWVDSIDLLDAFHPQTILAYGMNGRDLPIPHGAPVRLRLETQLGAKSLKFLNRLTVVDEFDDGGPIGAIQNGWAWYMGI